MVTTLFLLKNDLKTFIKENFGKLVIAGIIFITSAILGVRGAINIADIAEYCEVKNSALYKCLLNEGSLLVLFFLSLALYVVALFVVFVCSYGNLTLFLSYVVVVLRGYFCFFHAMVLLRYLGFKAMVFFVLYTAAVMFATFLYICYVTYVRECGLRYKYGWGELTRLCRASVPFYFAWGAVLILEVLAVGIGCLFI